MQRQNRLLNYFKPSIYVRSIKDISISQLKRQGIKLFVCDLDNVLVPHYTRLPNKESLDLIDKVRQAGMDFVIMSNNTRARVGMFGDKAHTRWYASAKKPFKFVAKKIMKEFGARPSETIMVGDQILLDILVANRMKWRSILVQPLVTTDYKMNRFNIFLEKFIYRHLQKNNLLRSGDSSKGEFWNEFLVL